MGGMIAKKSDEATEGRSGAGERKVATEGESGIGSFSFKAANQTLEDPILFLNQIGQTLIFAPSLPHGNKPFNRHASATRPMAMV
jgi:hypothetical protein